AARRDAGIGRGQPAQARACRRRPRGAGATARRGAAAMADTELIDGKAHAAALRTRVAAAAQALKARHGIVPSLAAVLVGDDPASQIYVRSKGKAATESGIASFEHRRPAATSESELLALLAELNADPAVDGILVQLPLPRQIAAQRVIAA